MSRLGSATLTAGANNSSTLFSGVMSGTGGFTKQGSGIQTFSAPTFTRGTTNVDAGTLQAGAVNAFSASSAHVVALNAFLALDNFDQTVGSLAGAGNVTLGSATLTAGGNNSSTLFSGVMSGTGGFTKQGSGIQTFSGANTYGGTTNVDAGTLQAGAVNAFSANSAHVVALNAFLGCLQYSSDRRLARRRRQRQSRQRHTDCGRKQFTSTLFSGAISGTGGFIKQGSGIQTFSGVNTYAGTTNVDFGTLQADAVNTLSANSAHVIALNAFLVAQQLRSDRRLARRRRQCQPRQRHPDGGRQQLSSTLFSGAISGTGGFIKQGSGNTDLLRRQHLCRHDQRRFRHSAGRRGQHPLSQQRPCDRAERLPRRSTTSIRPSPRSPAPAMSASAAPP